MIAKKSLAIKWRPQKFEDVVKQELTTKILKKVIELGSPKNAYLFSGASGCGKTTIARIFANELNKGVGAPIEIDAASNNGVDQVRAIIESANQRSLTGTYKVFIIDEAHAITSAGWQAFLKTLEEPPTYTIFMFCTTEPNKIPVTILNRIQRYNITSIEANDIKPRLEYICQQEGFINYTETCDLISKICKESMRDAITLLDQCADYSTDLSLENTKTILGDLPLEIMLKLTNFLVTKDEARVFAVIETLYAKGYDLKQFISMYLDFSLELRKYKLFQTIEATNIPSYLETTVDPLVNIKHTANLNNGDEWYSVLTDYLLEIKNIIKYDIAYKSTIEAYLLRMCRGV